MVMEITDYSSGVKPVAQFQEQPPFGAAVIVTADWPTPPVISLRLARRSARFLPFPCFLRSEPLARNLHGRHTEPRFLALKLGTEGERKPIVDTVDTMERIRRGREHLRDGWLLS